MKEKENCKLWTGNNLEGGGSACFVYYPIIPLMEGGKPQEKCHSRQLVS
jgi:hypothetical protein